MSITDILSELGTGITANMIWDHVKNMVFSSQQQSYTFVKTKMGTFLRIKGVDNSDVVAEKFLEYLLENKKIKIQDSVVTVTDDRPLKEIKVSNGGVGNIINNSGPGIGEEIIQTRDAPAQTTEVKGRGIGEIVINTGFMGKRITSIGNQPAAVTNVETSENVERAIGLMSSAIVTDCNSCKKSFSASKVIQGFAGNEVPSFNVRCPHCGANNLV